MKKNKQDIIHILLIVLLVVVYALLTTSFFKYSYGSATDWDTQHWMIPDYFRKQFYETGNLFNNFAPNIGDGQNIYYLSYYGYLSPVVLLSYLLPFIPMKIYIEAISIIGLLASGILFYLWMKKKYDAKLSFVVTLLFITSTPLLFHSHRHIMYTCYMPFLILALKEIDNKYINKRSERVNCRFILYLFLIIMSNYFFAVSALFAVSVYEFHNIFFYNKTTKITKKIKKEIINFVIEVGLAVMSAAILILPTFAVIFMGRSKANVDINLLRLFIPELSLGSLFYDAYSSGITLLSFAAIIRNTRSSKYNVLSILLLLSLLFPLVSFMLNGTMYLERKVLIPLIPLIIYNTAHFIKIIDDKKKKDINKYVKIFLIVLTIIFILLNLRRLSIILFVLELIALLVIMKQKEKKKLIMYYVIFLSLTNLLINTRTDVLEVNKEIRKVDLININELDKKYNYRFTTNNNILLNINNVESIDFNIGSIYSSTSNVNYKNYYYNFGVEVNQRSLGKISPTRNVLYNITNSNKYIVNNRKNRIETNEDALTIARSNMEMISLKEFNKLEYPYNMEALYKNLIVDKDIDNKFVSDIKEYKGDIYINKKKIDSKVEFLLEKDKVFNIKLNDINKDDLIIVEFDINDVKCPSDDRSISINRVKNVISCNNWKYYNQNNTFHYLFRNDKRGVSVRVSAGEYSIKNIKVYTLDYNKVKENIKNIDKIDLSIDRKNNNKIYGKYESQKDDIVYLQIPYDKGFDIKVNGVKKDYYIINNGMIGFDVSKGVNNIEIEFNAPLLKEAKIISIIGILSCVGIFIFNKTKKRDK